MAVPLGSSTKVASVRLKGFKAITLLVVREHFPIYFLTEGQVVALSSVDRGFSKRHQK